MTNHSLSNCRYHLVDNLLYTISLNSRCGTPAQGDAVFRTMALQHLFRCNVGMTFGDVVGLAVNMGLVHFDEELDQLSLKR